MNRIERLLWEEANVKEIARPKSRGSTCAKVVSIALLVGALGLLAWRPWPPSFPEARVQASAAKMAAAQAAAAQNRAPEAKAPASGIAGDGAVATQRGTRRDNAWGRVLRRAQSTSPGINERD
jgi:hypothetical protein